MKEQLRVGVVGAGYWGPKLIRNFYENRRTDLAMVADLSPERLEYVAGQYNVATTTDYRRLLDDRTIDAVVVATPIPTHFTLAREAMEAGKHVLVEKPLAGSVEEARALVEIADRTRRTLMVGHTFVYNPAVVALKEQIESGALGKIYYIDSARLNLGLFQSMNVLWDLAPHDLSILLYLLEAEPLSISARGNQSVRPGLYDNAYLDLHFPHNVMAHVHLSWLEPCKVRRTTVVGSERMAVYNDVSASEKLRIYDMGVAPIEKGETRSDFEWAYRYGNVTIPYVQFSEPLQIECNEFVDAIHEGRPARSDGRAGLQVVRLLEAAQFSLNHDGARVPLGEHGYQALAAGARPLAVANGHANGHGRHRPNGRHLPARQPAPEPTFAAD